MTRICASCKESRPKSSYSSNQWSKKKDAAGISTSRCKDCISGRRNAPSNEPGPDALAGALRQVALDYRDSERGRNGGSTAGARTDCDAGEGGDAATTKRSRPTTTGGVESCAACGKAHGALKRCTGCRCAWYCDATCQRADRKAHRDRCNQIAEMKRAMNVGEDDPDPIICLDCLEIFTLECELRYHRELCTKRNNFDVPSSPDAQEEESESEEDELDQEMLHDVFLQIEICEIELRSLDEKPDDEHFFDRLDLKEKHWQLCYQREMLVEEMRTKRILQAWEHKDAIAAKNVDGDNILCVLCKATMPLDGEDVLDTLEDEDDTTSDLFCAKRTQCTGSRYCPSHSKDEIPSKCPGCENPLCLTEDFQPERILHHARAGKSWAQLELAERYHDLDPTFTDVHHEDEYHYENEAIRWARKAADSGNVLAIIFLSKICHTGGIATKSNEFGPYEWKTFYDIPERERLLKKAADTGDANSMLKYVEFAAMWSEERSEAIKYLTVVTEVGDDKARAKSYRLLAEIYEREGRHEPERLMYLYEQASMPESGGRNGDPIAQARFSECLYDQSNKRLGSFDLPRYSQLPKMFFWADMSARARCSEGINFLSAIEDAVKHECMGCKWGGSKVRRKGKDKKKAGALFPCKRCKAAFFCDEACRVLFDLLGHEQVCCDCSSCEENRYMGFDDSVTKNLCLRAVPKDDSEED